MDETEFLRNEIQRLEQELENANRENVKAAQLGLSIIEEKEQLEKRLRETQILQEQTQSDLEFAQKVTEDVSDETESSATEKELTKYIRDLEKQLKSLKREKDRLLQENEELNRTTERYDSEFAKKSCEKIHALTKLKDCEARERKLQADLELIEDENLSLQKQIMMLETNKMELEAMKMEMESLRDQTFIQTHKALESETLASILKSQDQLEVFKDQLEVFQDTLEVQMLNETNELLLREKELHKNAKTEIEHLKWNTKTKTNPGLPDTAQHAKDIEEYLNASTNAELLRSLMFDHTKESMDIACHVPFSKDTNFALNQSGTPNDLLSEMNKAELSYLQNSIAQLTDQNAMLQKDLTQLQSSFTTQENQYKEAKTLLMKKQESEKELKKSLDERDASQNKICVRLDEMVGGYMPAIIKCICESIDVITNKNQIPEKLATNLKEKLTIMQKEMDCNMDGTLENVFDTVESEGDNDTKFVKGNNKMEQRIDSFEKTLKSLSKVLKHEFLPYVATSVSQTNIQHANETIADDFNMTNDELLVSENINDNQTNGESKIRNSKINGERTNSLTDREALLLREIQKLKADIVNKRCKNANYRQVLQNYKTTAETCFAKMQVKYTEERKVVSETLAKYRKELSMYKDDCVALSTQLSASRKECREAQMRTLELDKKCKYLESEHKILNSMLKTAIQQKFSLIEKVESLECFNFFQDNSQPNIVPSTVPNINIPSYTPTKNMNDKTKPLKLLSINKNGQQKDALNAKGAHNLENRTKSNANNINKTTSLNGEENGFAKKFGSVSLQTKQKSGRTMQELLSQMSLSGRKSPLISRASASKNGDS